MQKLPASALAVGLNHGRWTIDMLDAGHTGKDGLQARRLKEAVKYVSRTWLPVNSQLLEQVQRKLKEGYYQERRQHLIADIKSDFSLLAHCLRKLDGKLPDELVSVHPIQALRQLEIEEFTSILSAHDGEISSHRFEDMKDIQSSRLRHTLISCGTVETLARRNLVDPDFAYSCAMIRQLGFMLVAWNYPSTFQKAVLAVSTSGNDIESELANILGFLPAHLGFEICVNWNRSEDFRGALGWIQPVDRPQQSAMSFKENVEIAAGRQSSRTIARFCELGEILARVSNKVHYPRAVEEWKSVEGELAQLLGEGGMRRVSEHIKELSAPFVAVGGEMFARDFSPEGSVKKANAEYAERLLEENSYIKRCPETMQKDFQEVYKRMLTGDVSTDALTMLVSRLIPRAGFIRGCIYLLDPNTAQLVPRVRIGAVQGRKYKAISCSASGDHSNPISEAFHCSTPIKQENAFLHDDVVSHVSGHFGNADKGGVLHLEMSDALLSKDNHTPVLYFKAINKCLDHCLNLFK
ncbi:MAG: hypothetical protein K1X79_10375 [Oligoflexia bacterium]|nr:hypothetical protein [Oligoflexia bacterium]